MPNYNYTALNNNGSKKTGILTASSEREARKYIKELKLTPISVSLSNDRSSFKSRIKNKDIVLMTRQLATLLEANTSIIDALKITADQLNNNDLIGIILNLREDVIQGKRLGQSMKKYPAVFNNTYSSLVTAGDSSGNLDVIFNKLADYLEESASIRQKVISALTYPIILIGFSIVVIFGLLTFVLPQVVGQFSRAGAELPMLTEILIGLSNNILIILLFWFCSCSLDDCVVITRKEKTGINFLFFFDDGIDRNNRATVNEYDIIAKGAVTEEVFNQYEVGDTYCID